MVGLHGSTLLAGQNVRAVARPKKQQILLKGALRDRTRSETALFTTPRSPGDAFSEVVCTTTAQNDSPKPGTKFKEWLFHHSVGKGAHRGNTSWPLQREISGTVRARGRWAWTGRKGPSFAGKPPVEGRLIRADGRSRRDRHVETEGYTAISSGSTTGRGVAAIVRTYEVASRKS